jgi:hypothetical protein
MGGGGQTITPANQPAMNPLQVAQDRIARSDYHLAGSAGDTALSNAQAFMATRDAEAAAKTAANRGSKASTGGNWFGKGGTTFKADYSGSGLTLPSEY